MNILITGASGFLGYYLCGQLLNRDYAVVATGRGICRLPYTNNNNFVYAEMDFTDQEAVKNVFREHRPAVIVHAGAISKPDECELDRSAAYKINTEATGALLSEAAEYKSSFIYISTDFVFDGEKGMYTEEDITRPVNFYGQTKLEAEKIVKQYQYSWSIVRTVLVYGKPMAGRSNILTIVKEKLERGEEYKVVDDQVRTPTYVEDLATAIVSMIKNKTSGIFHISGEDVLTPYEMACKVADYLCLNKELIKRVTADTFSQPAKRPPRTGFNIDKARRELSFCPISFSEGLKKTFGD
ncbi:MAG: SDR family oxidoreductase [Chitinophagaceae bacterium]|nr:SDR family oxidoreductase [Chitinophagaceae bacterium]